MKKTVFFGLLVILLAFGLIGCPNGDDDCIVTFDLDGGNIDGNTSSVEITVLSGETITNFPQNPQKLNNIFDGWFSSKGGLGNVFTSETIVTSNRTVFAKWTSDNGNNGGDLFSGTWTGTINDADIRIVAADGSYQQYKDNVELIRGTYTFSGNTVTSKVTEFNVTFFEGTGGPANWVAWASLPDEIKIYVPEVSTWTISGNNVTINGGTLTK